jgi:hypothetical protein
MTLVEVMVAMALGSLVVLVLCTLTIYSARNFRALMDYTDLNQNSRMAMDKISKQIRQSRGLKMSPTTSSMVFQMNTNSGEDVSVLFDQSGKTLKLIDSSGTNLLSSDCTSFNWHLFDRNFVPTTDYNLCKMVQLDFTFSRHNLRTVTNSETIQSMKVVIRKKSDNS